jgi:endonuclease YncB( thermonuclease family)
MSIIEMNDAPSFSLQGYEVDAKVVSVYDGDSLKIIFPLHNVVYKWNCRLRGVDTPEIRTKNLKEKAFGYKVRDMLRKKLINQIVKLSCDSFDKYGRLLVTVRCEEDDCTVNQWLLNNNYAVEYNGGKRVDWSTILSDD